MVDQYFQSADISPEVVLAGDTVEFRIKLVLGKDFSADQSRIIVDFPGYLGTSRPTRLHQELNGFVEIFCTNPDVYYTQRIWDMEVSDFSTSGKSGFKGMAQRVYVIDFTRGKAVEGDEIEIVWGYMCDGFSSGTYVSSIVLSKEFYNTIHVRYFKDGSQGLPDYERSFKGYERPQPDAEIPLKFRVIPREPQLMRLIRRQSFSSLLLMDRFFNVCNNVDIKKYICEDIQFTENSHGVFETPKPFIKVTSTGLPLLDTPAMTDVYEGYNIYFGDLHTHSAASNDCIEREKQEMTQDMSFRFAKEVACLDFLAISDHHQPWDIERNKIGKENWDKLSEAVVKYNKSGDFLAFPAFEFRCERGDTTVVFNENLPYEVIDDPSIKNIKDLWEKFKDRAYITIPHFHFPGKLKEGEWYTCPYEGVETCLEIFSCHASYERDDVLERHIAEIKSMRPDRHGKYFLQNGYHYGYLCNSDGHKGNPGFNGLTAVYAKELTREAVLEAIRSRRVYGTTNARIRLLFTINGHLMGSILPNEAEKVIKISLQGERPFKAVDVFRNGELFQRFRPGTIEFKTEFNVCEEGPSNWYIRATQYDNHISYSSPIWFK